ncbi:hypothetical protein LUZ60_010900 [Juncus effusus]|nr:hypothetical protein LUZ60_010900 [Juncus effusus]
MNRPGYITLPIITVMFCICYVYYTTVFIAIEGWLGLFTAAGLANAAAYTALAVICIATYTAAVVKDPGRVPASFVPDMERPNSPIHEIKRKGGDLRYCQKCCHYKPPRAHHCRVCKRCVLRMDHHCIWINNCVGHENYKAFLIFVFYAVIACIHSFVLIVGDATQNVPNKEEIPSNDSSRTSLIICGVLLCPLTLALAILLGWHIYLILQNKTTIEHHEGVRATWLAEKAGNIYRHPYNLGIYQNLITILGPNVCCWFWPSSNYIGSGLRFRTAYDLSPPPV